VVRFSVARSTALVASSDQTGLVCAQAAAELALADGQHFASLADRRVPTLRRQRPSAQLVERGLDVRLLADSLPYPRFCAQNVSNGTRPAEYAVAFVAMSATRFTRCPSPGWLARIGEPDQSFANVVFLRRSPTMATCVPRSTSTEMPRTTGPLAVRIAQLGRADLDRSTGGSTPGSGSTARRQVRHRQDLPPAGDRGLRVVDPGGL
jgi:hypothetical protein